MAKKRRTTFAKTQRERARLEKQAEKRARRQNRGDEDPEFAGPRPVTETMPETWPEAVPPPS
jgi:hypothetical protein